MVMIVVVIGGNSSLVIKFTEKHDKNMKLITKHTRTHKVW